jgi:hypothetical protein
VSDDYPFPQYDPLPGKSGQVLFWCEHTLLIKELLGDHRGAETEFKDL